jgi:hypothetical protein
MPIRTVPVHDVFRLEVVLAIHVAKNHSGKVSEKSQLSKELRLLPSILFLKI